MDFWTTLFIISLVTGFTADAVRKNEKQDEHERDDFPKILLPDKDGLKLLVKFAVMVALIALAINIMVHLCYEMNTLF